MILDSAKRPNCNLALSIPKLAGELKTQQTPAQAERSRDASEDK